MIPGRKNVQVTMVYCTWLGTKYLTSHNADLQYWENGEIISMLPG